MYLQRIFECRRETLSGKAHAGKPRALFTLLLFTLALAACSPMPEKKIDDGIAEIARYSRARSKLPNESDPRRNGSSSQWPGQLLDPDTAAHGRGTPAVRADSKSRSTPRRSGKSYHRTSQRDYLPGGNSLRSARLPRHRIERDLLFRRPLRIS